MKLGPAQAPVQDIDAHSHTHMLKLSRLDFISTQTVSSFLQGSDKPVQGPPLQAVPVFPCLHQGHKKVYLLC